MDKLATLLVEIEDLLPAAVIFNNKMFLDG
jgi:hypothetical protein